MKCLLVLGVFCFSMLGLLLAQENADPRIEQVLNYWFNHEKDLAGSNKFWFGRSEATDREIRDKFESLVSAASGCELTSWTSSPKGRLALIIVLDQFPRNIYRNTPQAFAYDQLGQKLALEGIEKREDLQLSPVERVFFYLPLEHAESLPLQELSVSKFSELLSQIPENEKKDYMGYLDYAKSHYRDIKTFGRFPYRNSVLNRPSTQEELDFLNAQLSF